jgi:hypothetical protein
MEESYLNLYKEEMAGLEDGVVSALFLCII